MLRFNEFNESNIDNKQSKSQELKDWKNCLKNLKKALFQFENDVDEIRIISKQIVKCEENIKRLEGEQNNIVKNDKKINEYLDTNEPESFIKIKNQDKFISLKSIAHIIEAMRENNSEKSINLIKKFKPVDGLFIRDNYIIKLACDLNMTDVFKLLYKKYKEI